MLNRIAPFLSKDMHALKSSKFYHVPFLEFRLKCNLYQILSGTKHFLNPNQTQEAVSLIWNILLSSHLFFLIHQCPDQIFFHGSFPKACMNLSLL